MKQTIFGAMISLVLLAAFPLNLWAEEPKLRVAVMEIEDQTGIFSKSTLTNATDLLRTKLAATGRVVVIDKSSQEKALKEMIQTQKKESYKECYDQSCQIPLGQAVSADTMVRSKITKFGESCLLTAEMVDLAMEATTKGAEADFNCMEEGLQQAIGIVVEKLTGAETEPTPADSGAPAKKKSKYTAMVEEDTKEKEAREEAWKDVKEIALNSEIPSKKRISVLNAFLTDFPNENPYKAEADFYLSALENGDEPGKISYLNPEKMRSKFVEWFSFRVQGGSHGGGGMMSFFTLKWKYFFWTIMRGGGAGVGPGLGGHTSWFGIGGMQFGVPFQLGYTGRHELRFGTGLYGGVLFTNESSSKCSDEYDCVDLSSGPILPLEINYIYHISYYFALEMGLELFIPTLAIGRGDYWTGDLPSPALMGFFGFRI